MEVIAPGVDVLLAEGEITAKVLAVMYEGEGTVSYKVAWWNGKTRCQEWVSGDEVVRKGEKHVALQVGFKPFSFPDEQ